MMSKPLLKNEAVGRAFRRLADEHFAPDAKRDEATWQKIQERTLAGATGLHSVRIVEKPGRGRLVWGAVAAAAAAVLVGVLSWEHEPEAFTYSVDEMPQVKDASALNDAPGELVATEEREVLVHFSDESRAVLAPHSTIRLSVSDGPARLEARLAQGEVAFEAGPESKAQVQLFAGTFRLETMGASFVFSYFPGEGEARLTTKGGEVNFMNAAGESQRVVANQSVTLLESSALRGAPKIGEVPETAIPADQQKSVVGKEKKGNEQLSKGEPSASRNVRRAPDSSPGVSFAQLAAAGKFAEVVELARTQGISQVLASASASELQELAQAARYSGNLALAAQVWTQMTTRFSGDSVGKNARFFLGRLAEQQGNISGALANYDRYLSGAKSGVYTAEALGRKLNLVHKSQGVQQAQPLAREYLRLFPTGPYARLAREVISAPAQVEAD